MRSFLIILLAAVTFGILATAAGLQITRAAKWLWQLLIGLIVAIATGLAAGIGAAAAGLADPGVFGIVAGLVAVAIAMLRPATMVMPDPMSVGTHATFAEGETTSVVVGPPPRSRRRWTFSLPKRRADQLEDAWASLEALWPNSSRLMLVRSTCERLLQQALRDRLDPALLEWAVFVRKRVPQLTTAFHNEYARAPASDRARLKEELLDALERIAAEAERRADRSKAAGSDFDLQRQHIVRRTGRDPFDV